MASQLVQPFLHTSWQEVPILYNGPPLFSWKLPLCMGILTISPRYWPPSNTWFLGPLKSTYQMTSRSVQSFLHGSRSWQTDQHTDHAIPSVTTGRVYAVLWCGPIINIIVHLWSLSFVSHLRTVVLSSVSMQIQFNQKISPTLSHPTTVHFQKFITTLWVSNPVDTNKLECGPNAQRDGRPAKCRWRPLFNAAKWNPLKFAGGAPNSPTDLSR